METTKIRGCTIKIVGECDLVPEIAEILREVCEVVHFSRLIYHSEDDGCHLYMNVSEVKPE